MKFVLDGKLPIGACHHQKMIVVDDAIAFCGGGDIGPDRWDTPEHLDDNPRREKTRRDNKCFDSRHEVMGLVDGAAAAALGELFRDRWRRATGETLDACPPVRNPNWPGKIAAGVRRHRCRAYRAPARPGATIREVRENEALHVASIRAAKACIYMENQYFTSPLIAAELAKRLAEPDGPEVVTDLDRAFAELLRPGDHGPHPAGLHPDAASQPTATAASRPTARSPRLGRTIIVHAKLTIIDDVLLRIGSANINNRSMGFDTECDLSLEAAGSGSAANRAEITRLRNRLLAHWLGCAEQPIADGHRARRAASARRWRRCAPAATAGCARSSRSRLKPLGRLHRRLPSRRSGRAARLLAAVETQEGARCRRRRRPEGGGKIASFSAAPLAQQAQGAKDRKDMSCGRARGEIRGCSRGG